MSLTETYTRLSRAFECEGSRLGVRPNVVRVLLAVHELGGEVLTTELSGPLGLSGKSAATTRRELRTAFNHGLARGVAENGGPRVRGATTRVCLTDAGFEVARAVERSVLTVAA